MIDPADAEAVTSSGPAPGAEWLVEPRRALVVAAHPDDAELAAGGTIAGLAAAGWRVRYLVVSDGSRGSRGPLLSRERRAELRAGEQREAARILGVREACFLGEPDGELQEARGLLGAILGELLAFRPAAVYTHDPEPVVIKDVRLNHPDHRATGLATVHAASSSRWCSLEHALASKAAPLRRELYLWGSNAPNVEVEIAATLDRKLEALRAHRSQFEPDEIDAVALAAHDHAGRAFERFRRVVVTG
jgi:LmbE family N-acetylglucosaminyl deacetylase